MATYYKRMIYFLLSLILFGATELSFAQSLHWEDLPYEHINTLISRPGETKNQFLIRIAPQLRAYSDRTGFEACGVIGSNQKGLFGVVLGSNHSHLACANNSNLMPQGMTSIDETIHSHGSNRSFQMSRVDKLFTGRSDNGSIVSMSLATRHGQILDHFSPQDFNGGWGYLATPEGLLFQKGKGTETKVTSESSSNY